MIYKDDFENWKEVLEQFDATKLVTGKELPLFAVYANEGYDGSAFVLYIENNKLFSVYGGHCSCFGLEDQWEPEEIDWSIAVQFLEQTWYCQDYKDIVIPLVTELVKSEDRANDINELRTVVALKYGNIH